MSIELEVFTAYDHPPTLSQLQAGIERLCRLKAVFEKKKEDTEAEWTWAHFFQVSSPDVGGFSIERTVVNRKMREALERLKTPREFTRGINWCFTLSAPDDTEQQEIEMMYAAAGVLAKFTRGKVYDAQEDAVLEADELAGSITEVARQRNLLPDGAPSGAPRRPPPKWASAAVSVGLLVAFAAAVLFILQNLFWILSLIGAGVVAVVGYNIWKKEGGGR